MPYALRNESGEIIALTASPNHENDPAVSLADPEVLRFMSRDLARTPDQNKFTELLAADLKQIRIVEDLIDLLTSKGLILFSDLPVAAQEKILQKKHKREEMEDSNDILVNDNPIL